MFFDIGWSEAVIISLVYFHITAILFSIYYHRSVIHNLVTYSPKTIKIFEFIASITHEQNIFLLRGGHLNHHQYSDRPGDVVSPHVSGWKNIMVYPIFRKSAKLIISLIPFTKNTSYEKIFFVIMNIFLFGAQGVMISFLMYFFIYFFGNFVFDGLAHLPYVGYRNYNTDDSSRNILPFGLLAAGEELHNNHHADPMNIKYSHKWFEFDIGYMYIKILEKFNLAKINYGKDQSI